MNNENCGMTDQQKLDCHRACYFRKKISWTAIIVGTLVGIGLSYLHSQKSGGLLTATCNLPKLM